MSTVSAPDAPREDLTPDQERMLSARHELIWIESELQVASTASARTIPDRSTRAIVLTLDRITKRVRRVADCLEFSPRCIPPVVGAPHLPPETENLDSGPLETPPFDELESCVRESIDVLDDVADLLSIASSAVVSEFIPQSLSGMLTHTFMCVTNARDRLEQQVKTGK